MGFTIRSPILSCSVCNARLQAQSVGKKAQGLDLGRVLAFRGNQDDISESERFSVTSRNLLPNRHIEGGEGFYESVKVFHFHDCGDRCRLVE